MDLDTERRVYALVLQALEKDPAELESFLSTVCGATPELRREVVKRLNDISELEQHLHVLVNEAERER